MPVMCHIGCEYGIPGSWLWNLKLKYISHHWNLYYFTLVLLLLTSLDLRNPLNFLPSHVVAIIYIASTIIHNGHVKIKYWSWSELKCVDAKHKLTWLSTVHVQDRHCWSFLMVFWNRCMMWCTYRVNTGGHFLIVFLIICFSENWIMDLRSHNLFT